MYCDISVLVIGINLTLEIFSVKCQFILENKLLVYFILTIIKKYPSPCSYFIKQANIDVGVFSFKFLQWLGWFTTAILSPLFTENALFRVVSVSVWFQHCTEAGKQIGMSIIVVWIQVLVWMPAITEAPWTQINCWGNTIPL